MNKPNMNGDYFPPEIRKQSTATIGWTVRKNIGVTVINPSVTKIFAVRDNINNIQQLKIYLADQSYRKAFRIFKDELPAEIRKILNMMEILEK